MKKIIYICVCICILLLIFLCLIKIDYVEGFSNGKILVFFHIYCNSSTKKIMQEQIIKMIFSPLYEKVDYIYCFLTGEPEYINICNDEILLYGKKFIIKDIGANDKTYERFTLHLMKKYINPDDKVLYIHSKGVTKPDDINVYLWRTYMEYYMFVKCEKCIKLLDDYDVVGVDFQTRNNTPHFSGNFWWTTGKYYLSLPDEIGPGYIDPELYIFKNNPKYIELKNSGRPSDLYYYPYYVKEYIDDD